MEAWLYSLNHRGRATIINPLGTRIIGNATINEKIFNDTTKTINICTYCIYIPCLIPLYHIDEASNGQLPLGMRQPAFDQISSLRFEQLPILKPRCTESTWGPC